LFLAVVVAAGIWRKTTLQRERLATIRLAIEKGQASDPAVLDRVFREQADTPRDTITGALATIAAGVGLGIMGLFISIGGDTTAMFPLLGVGVMITLIGIATLLGQRLDRRRSRTDL
jgi:hypothetical protein